MAEKASRIVVQLARYATGKIRAAWLRRGKAMYEAWWRCHGASEDGARQHNAPSTTPRTEHIMRACGPRNTASTRAADFRVACAIEG